MKINPRAAAKVRQVRALWREVNPDTRLRNARITRGQLSLSAERVVDADAIVDWFVDFQRDNGSRCVTTIRMGLQDERIAPLRTIAEGFDCSRLGFLDVDVVAAANMIAGHATVGYPMVPASAPRERWRRVLEGYRQHVEDIWRFAGGWNRRGFQTLAIWALRHRHEVHAFRHGFGFICPAFVYGEPELGQALIEEYLQIWDENVRQDPSDLAFRIRDDVRAAVERLRAAVRSPTVH